MKTTNILINRFITATMYLNCPANSAKMTGTPITKIHLAWYLITLHNWWIKYSLFIKNCFRTDYEMLSSNSQIWPHSNIPRNLYVKRTQMSESHLTACKVRSFAFGEAPSRWPQYRKGWESLRCSTVALLNWKLQSVSQGQEGCGGGMSSRLFPTAGACHHLPSSWLTEAPSCREWIWDQPGLHRLQLKKYQQNKQKIKLPTT